jgi:hypothetical protein
MARACCVNCVAFRVAEMLGSTDWGGRGKRDSRGVEIDYCADLSSRKSISFCWQARKSRGGKVGGERETKTAGNTRSSSLHSRHSQSISTRRLSLDQPSYQVEGGHFIWFYSQPLDLGLISHMLPFLNMKERTPPFTHFTVVYLDYSPLTSLCLQTYLKIRSRM